MSKINLTKIDWTSVSILSLLIVLGLGNIYSSSQAYLLESLLNYNAFTKQLIFVILSIIIFLFIQFLPFSFFIRYSSLLYVFSIISLICLFIFGNEVNGALAWYKFNGFSLQPSEFAKPITALALAKYLSDINSNLKTIQTQFYSFLIVLIPIILIGIQPDPGTIIIFLSFILVFYKVGLPSIYMNLFVGFILLFFTTIVFTPKYVLAFIILLVLIFIFFKKNMIKKTLIYGAIFSVLVLSVDFIFNNVFEQRHRDRFNVVIGLEQDNRGVGYNSNQSRIAFASGGILGEGFLKGSQTRGKFVPEQHTDYIFSTVGEEWGFLGSSLVIILFMLLLYRIIYLAETHKNKFGRIYGYGLASILFFHVIINIGMVIQLLPTVGIPLPFFSYGGSSLWGFTLLLFIFIKLDANKSYDW